MNIPKQDFVLILGNSQTTEMNAVLDAVSQICQMVRISDLSCLNAISTEIECPGLIVICQNWSDEFSRDDWNDLVKRFPISRFVCCYGVWCESDGRTRDVWPLSTRVPARCARVRIQQEWDIVKGKENAFPLTAGRDEIFQLQVTAEPCKLNIDGGSPVIGIHSGDRWYQTMLEEMIVSWGAQVANKSQQCEADLLILDLDPWELVEREHAAQTGVPPMIGMMGLSHFENIVASRLYGFETIVCKLAPELELFQAVKRSLEIKVFPQVAN
ncbi:hypothetical protein [uncultured Gimesia sp.]|uniref:hypothetical protein n=1 Tax=uncultured Gimesia sp. TaxID=1678688 RepID=UPI002607DF9D|nr:hypothetical protein [uncultured Gimesia sp.]